MKRRAKSITHELAKFLTHGRLAPGVPGGSVQELRKKWGPTTGAPRGNGCMIAEYGRSWKGEHYAHVMYRKNRVLMLNLNFHGKRLMKGPAPLVAVMRELLTLTNSRRLKRFGFCCVGCFHTIDGIEINYKKTLPAPKSAPNPWTFHFTFLSKRKGGRRLLKPSEITIDLPIE